MRLRSLSSEISARRVPSGSSSGRRYVGAMTVVSSWHKISSNEFGGKHEMSFGMIMMVYVRSNVGVATPSP
tara:strand:- start:733 stop:945 length:213 start_codon:yes stop_codon:yes gene_type:complete